MASAPVCWDSTAAGTASCSRRSASTPERLPSVSDEPVDGWYPALGDGACSNVGAGCADARAGGADDRNVGRAPDRRPSDGAAAATGPLPLPRRRRARLSRAARSPTAATSTPGSSGRCACPTTLGSPSGEPDGPRLDVPAAARRRAQPRLERGRARRGRRASRSRRRRVDLLQAALEGVALALRRDRRPAAEVDEIVATGGALDSQPGLGADPRRRARAAGDALGVGGGLGARRGGRRARAARDAVARAAPGDASRRAGIGGGISFGAGATAQALRGVT